MHRPSTSTMSSSFHTHGLIGIDLHHVQAQRAVQLGTTVPGRSMWTGLRRAMATFCITAAPCSLAKRSATPPNLSRRSDFPTILSTGPLPVLSTQRSSPTGRALCRVQRGCRLVTPRRPVT
jgi:hypothetical protein